ncbi:MAG TPA: hypothetical protein VEB20_10375 [Azospirillaceae bacterium]|nr:hypothetical protein [Azospirillaceae bacterium]
MSSTAALRFHVRNADASSFAMHVSAPEDIRIARDPDQGDWTVFNPYARQDARRFPCFMLTLDYAAELIRRGGFDHSALGVPLEQLLERFPFLISEDERAAEAAGEAAFQRISARVADALRGTKSQPANVRNPYRNPAKAAAWSRGFDRTEAEFTRDWYADMAA